MLASTALLLLAPLPLAFAQYSGGAVAPALSSTRGNTSPGTTTSLLSGSLQTVTVGQNGALAFSPNSIVAPVSSQVEFIFYPL